MLLSRFNRLVFFFFNDTATTEIYTLSLHDALPISWGIDPERLGAYFVEFRPFLDQCRFDNCRHLAEPGCGVRSEEHTSELQSRLHLVCRLLLEKKKNSMYRMEYKL